MNLGAINENPQVVVSVIEKDYNRFYAMAAIAILIFVLSRKPK